MDPYLAALYRRACPPPSVLACRKADAEAADRPKALLWRDLPARKPATTA
jgi:hypothetical protein